jgi:tetratricopeptide (TPR) repeat protein
VALSSASNISVLGVKLAKGPKNFQGIMVSSTFTDLREHRQKVISAIEGLGHKAVVMEHSGAQTGDVISVSKEMVADCAAYVLLISHKYGQTPRDASNPEVLSITELEFNEAVKLGRPRLLFVISDDHDVKKSQLERDPAKEVKLEKFKARAKLVDPSNKDSDLACIYEEFDSVEDLAAKAAIAIGKLISQITPVSADKASDSQSAQIKAAVPVRALPEPPALRALPPYIGSHKFMGRRAELDALNDWASPSDQHPVLLFEAIGGSGKSILTWNWMNEGSGKVRDDWSGKFWYSFYEQGATMAQFCREALAYVLKEPVESFQAMRGHELAERLVEQLNTGKWLMALDGLERILVAYHRIDAAQLRDEEAEDPHDSIAQRDPCICIRPEDDELLRLLSSVSGSKLLISTRLTPAVFINKSGNAIPGVRRELLKGLRPSDAEELFRSCGVDGPSADIQAFLQANCDCHPLVIGVLAGLVNSYPRDHGNFVGWRDDPTHGGALNLADCDLVQRRNHILDAAIAAVDPKGRELLQLLSMLLGGADYDFLLEVNPHLPPKPVEVEKPIDPASNKIWNILSQKRKIELSESFEKSKKIFDNYRKKIEIWKNIDHVVDYPKKLNETIRDLDKRGLLQFDALAKRYDLHPVVRGVASGRMNPRELALSGAKVVDYCRTHSPKQWDDAKTHEEVSLGVQLVSTLLCMEKFDEAADVLTNGLDDALQFNLEANDEIISFCRKFFPLGWNQLPLITSMVDKMDVMTIAAFSLVEIEGLRSDSALQIIENVANLALNGKDANNLVVSLLNIVISVDIAYAVRLLNKIKRLCKFSEDHEIEFLTELRNAEIISLFGEYALARRQLIDLLSVAKPTNRGSYISGQIESRISQIDFRQSLLTSDQLDLLERVCTHSNYRSGIRQAKRLRGLWHLSAGRTNEAIESLRQAVAMARDSRQRDQEAEMALLLAELRSGIALAFAEIEQIDVTDKYAHYYLGLAWIELGESKRAEQALWLAHDLAEEQGEPYVHRWLLDQTRAGLADLECELRPVKQYDLASAVIKDWEIRLDELIAKLEAEKAGRENEKGG